MKSTNVTHTFNLVSQGENFKRQGHLGGVLWFTGLPASGKKTLAYQMEKCLFDLGYQVFAFDSVWLREGLTSDLQFSREDRKENIRRAGELAALLSNIRYLNLSLNKFVLRSRDSVAGLNISEVIHFVTRS